MKHATNKRIKCAELIKSINSGEIKIINYLFLVYLGMYRGSLDFLYITGMADAPSRLANEISKNRSSKQQQIA